MKVFTQWRRYAKYKLLLAKLSLLEYLRVDKVRLKLVFGRKEQSIDLETLTEALENFFGASREVCKEVCEDRQVKIEVNATSPGSFQIDITVATQILDRVKHLVGACFDNVDKANVIVQFLIGCTRLKQILKGKKPDKVEDAGEQTKIVLEGKTIYVKNEVYNIYSGNKKYNICMEKLFKTLHEDGSIEEFRVAPEGDIEPLYIPREDFAGMAAENQLLSSNEIVESIKDAELKIVKLVWEPRRKWEFIYNGTKISARIEDKDFHKRIDEGESFSKNDIIVCDLEITMVFDEEEDAYLPKDFKIVKVKQHKPRNDLQNKIPFK